MTDEHTLLLGEIKGKLDLVIRSQNDMGQNLQDIDSRLRRVEVKAATNGALAGGVVSVGVALLAESIKRKIGM